MPQFIIPAIAALGVSTAVATVIYYAAVLIISVAVGSAQAKRARRKAINDYNASLQDRLVMQAVYNAARSEAYGRVRNTGGIIFKGSYGPDKRFYTFVIALKNGESDGIERVFFRDIPLDLISDGAGGFYVTNPEFSKRPLVSAAQPATMASGAAVVVLPNPPVAGSVSAYVQGNSEVAIAVVSVVGSTVTLSNSGGYSGPVEVGYQWEGFDTKARIWMYNGTSTQDLSFLLSPRFPGLITASDQFRGITCLVVELIYDQEAYPSGIPSITAVFRGKKVLDPRTGVTAWTENPALIARDWALYAYGGGCAINELYDARFIAAANACDVVTTFQLAGGGTETRALYQCGIVCQLDYNPDDTMDEIVKSMAGQWAWQGGMLSLVAGVYRAPVADIDDTWLSGLDEITVVKDQSITDTFNILKPTISNADGYVNGATGPVTNVAYTPTALKEVRSTTMVAEDGRDLPREITFGGVTRAVHAQHICGVMLRENREALTVVLPCNFKAVPIELFDVVRLTLPVFGFAAKEFEVRAWQFDFEKGVKLTLRETGAAIFSPSTDLDPSVEIPNTTLPSPWAVTQMQITNVTSGTVALKDGTMQTRVRVTWPQTVDVAVAQSGKIEVQYLPAGNAAVSTDAWPSLLVEGAATEAIITGLNQGMPYLFRIRPVTTLGVRGKWSRQVQHYVAQPGITLPPNSVDTPQIVDEAATVALSARSASGSWPSSSGPGLGLVRYLEWFNDTGETMDVQLEWSVKGTAAGGTGGYGQFVFTSKINSIVFEAIAGSPINSGTSIDQAKISTITVPAGGFGMLQIESFAAASSGVTTLTWTEAVIRLTVIKR